MFTTTGYRPAGVHALQLFEASGLKTYPQQLAEQAIIYPVTSLAYARQIGKA